METIWLMLISIFFVPFTLPLVPVHCRLGASVFQTRSNKSKLAKGTFDYFNSYATRFQFRLYSTLVYIQFDRLKVICARLKLTAIPSGIPQETHELVLEGNQIATLPNNAFGTQTLPNLTTLVLRGNALASIARDALLLPGRRSEQAATPGLKTLDLSGNQLPSIPEFRCDLMPNLTSLILQRNQFTSAKFPDSYAKCKRLKAITLTSNQGVQSLEKDDFMNLKARPLRLEIGNNVSAIDPQTFVPLKSKLSTLGLSENPIGYTGLQNALTALNGSTVLASLHLNALLGDGLIGMIFPLLESFSATTLKSVSMNSNRVYALGGTFSGNVSALTGFECDSCLLESVKPVFKSGAIPQLKRVMLQRNRLTSVPTTLPSTLLFLYLDGNPITQVSNGDFKDYNLLQELRLGGTTLKSIANDSFSGLQKLRSLILVNASLTDGALVAGRNSFFKGLNALKTLELSGNAIAQLADATVFADLKNLTSLTLNAQRTADKLGLTSIDPKVLAPLTALTTLSGNAGFGSKIAGDTSGALLQPLAKLSSLALDGCGISSIPPAYFSGVASSLTTLSLSENAIPVPLLTDGALAYLKKMQTLRLANSSLQYVPRKVLVQWPQLELLDLRDNPFACDANLQELHEWLQAATQNFTLPDAQTSYYAPSATQLLVLGYRSYACASPPACADVQLADPMFSARLANCTGVSPTPTPPPPSKSTKGVPPAAQSTAPPAVSHQSRIWLALVLTLLGLFLVAAGGLAGWWVWRRRRSGYYPIDMPINA